MVDLSKIRVGDEVTVCAKVAALPDAENAEYRVNIEGGEPWCHCTSAAFATHTPKPREIKVGDVVRWCDGGTIYYEVIALRGDAAWIVCEREAPFTVSVALLRHADP